MPSIPHKPDALRSLALSALFALFLAAFTALFPSPSPLGAEPPHFGKGSRIAVLTGSAGDLAAHRHFPEATFLAMDSSSDAALAITAGKADAFVYDRSVLLNIAHQNPQLQLLAPPLDRLEVAIALRKGDPLKKTLDQLLGELQTDGTLSKLYAKWIEPPYREIPDLTPLYHSGAPESEGELTLGTTATMEPFTFHSRGTITGLDIDLGRIIANRLHKRLRVIDMQFSALIPALEARKIDIALSNFNVTPERQERIDFSRPYIKSSISILTHKPLASPPDPTTLPDLQGKRVGVILGSVMDTYMQQHHPQVEIVQYNSAPELLLAIETRKADLGLMPHQDLRKAIELRGGIRLLGGPLFSTPVAFGFRKDQDTLRRQMDRFLKELMQSGTYQEIRSRWTERGESRMPEIPPYQARRELTVGLMGDRGLPYAIMQDGRLAGYNVELLERFGAATRTRIRYADMKFSSLMPALASAKIDMIGEALSITPERQRKIAFSDPYDKEVYYFFTASADTLAPPPAPFAGGITTTLNHLLGELESSFRQNVLVENRWMLLLDGLKVTVIISLFSIILGTLIGALVCWMRMSSSSFLRTPAKAYIAVLRGTPVLVFLMLVFYVVFASVPIDPVAVAIIAFGMNFGAYTSEMFRAGIEGVEPGQREGGIAMGFTQTGTFLSIILPQAVRTILPVYTGESVSLVKMTSVVGYIAVQDLTKVSDIIRSRTFDAFFPLVMIAIFYFLLAWILTAALERLERKLNPRKRPLRH